MRGVGTCARVAHLTCALFIWHILRALPLRQALYRPVGREPERRYPDTGLMGQDYVCSHTAGKLHLGAKSKVRVVSMHTTGAHTPAHTGPSLLETVAEHESALLGQLEDSERQGRLLLEEAQAEATAFLTEDYGQLEREVAELRRKAAEDREADVLSVQRACDAKVAGIRSGAAQKLDQVFSEVVRRVLPRA